MVHYHEECARKCREAPVEEWEVILDVVVDEDTYPVKIAYFKHSIYLRNLSCFSMFGYAWGHLFLKSCLAESNNIVTKEEIEKWCAKWGLRYLYDLRIRTLIDYFPERHGRLFELEPEKYEVLSTLEALQRFGIDALEQVGEKVVAYISEDYRPKIET
ncbi:MAG TPA: hypothetical protein P5056_01635 [Candidatus Paceibacterota bacterium]|nr:hypothetical protein [Candidatus Paceibacterota bacterium]